MSTGTALAPAEKSQGNARLGSITKTLEAQKDRIQSALGEAFSAERMIQIVRSNAYKSGDLQKCDTASIFAAVMRAATLRLDLEPSAMEAYLIPRYNSKQRIHECSFQIGYQGVRKLVLRSGNVAAFETVLVYENEPFRYRRTPAMDFLHEPILRPSKRGEIVGGYGYGRMKGGDPFISYMPIEEILYHKSRGKGDQPAWESDFDQMCHKTLVIRLGKSFPKNPELIDALADEYDSYGDDPAYGQPRRPAGSLGLKQRLQLEVAPEPEFTTEDGVAVPLRSEDDEPEVIAPDDDEISATQGGRSG